MICCLKLYNWVVNQSIYGRFLNSTVNAFFVLSDVLGTSGTSQTPKYPCTHGSYMMELGNKH